MTPKEIEDISKTLGVFLKQFEAVTNQSIEASFKNARTIEQAGQTINQTVSEALGRSEKQLQEIAHNIITHAFEPKIIEFEQRIEKAMNHLEEKIIEVDQRVHSMNKQNKYLSWKAVIGAGFAMFAMAIGMGVYVENRYQALQSIKNVDKKTQYSVRAKEILNKMEMRQCDGRPCVETDPDAGGYGEKGKYRVLGD